MALVLKKKGVEVKTIETPQETYQESEFLNCSDDIRVEVGMGATVNTGNFNSVKFHCTVTRSCDVGLEDKTFEDCKAWVIQKMEEIHKEVSGD